MTTASRAKRSCSVTGDVVIALERASRDDIAGDDLADRRARAAGAPVGTEYEPPELAPG